MMGGLEMINYNVEMLLKWLKFIVILMLEYNDMWCMVMK